MQFPWRLNRSTISAKLELIREKSVQTFRCYEPPKRQWHHITGNGIMSERPQQTPVYNNKRFRVSDYNFEMFIGPRAGDDFRDFTLTDLATGEELRLSDFAGKWVVIETGSSTCSMYTHLPAEWKKLHADVYDNRR